VESLKILLLSVVAAVAYGILHDQVTARVCVEYFTIGHPPVFATQDPTALALGWGVIATWWMGVLLGLPLALTAAFGSRPKLTARALLKPMGVVMGCVAVLALIAGVIGYGAARMGLVRLAGPLAERVPPEKHAAFLADAWAHTASYGGGFLAGMVLWTWAGRRRDRLQRQASGGAENRTPSLG
jgi:hypothetical protein